MNQFSILVRSLARRLGLTKLIRMLSPAREYEDKFSKALLADLRVGDTVWDVGANVGLYTLQFAQIVGSTGKVVAFEPNPTCCEEIRKKLDQPHASVVALISVALGEEDGQAFLQIGRADMAVDSRITTGAAGPGDSCVAVDICSGDSAISKRGAPVPNVMKIDVEGFELECLLGLKTTLADSRLRSVFIEVHFTVLESRGMRYAAIEIQKLLKQAGFSEQQWLDASHLLAKR